MAAQQKIRRPFYRCEWFSRQKQKAAAAALMFEQASV
jgi:hypothetical protein